MRSFANFLTGLVSLALTIVIAVFAVANRGPVTIDLWPFDIELDMPLFLLAVGTLALGLLVGAFLLWLPMLRWRSLARSRQRKVLALEQVIAKRDAAASVVAGSVTSSSPGGPALPPPA